MSVHYSTSIGWGLRLKESDIGDFDDWMDSNEVVIPLGFEFSPGGDMMDSKNVAWLIHPTRLFDKIISSLHGPEGDSYGVFRPGEISGQYTNDELDTLVNFARQYTLDEDIDWFVVSEVG